MGKKLNATKTEQLQVRVSSEQKRLLQKRAGAAKMSVSEWVLSCALAKERTQFESITRNLTQTCDPSYAFASLHDLLKQLDPGEFETTLGAPPSAHLDEKTKAIIAAMIEQAAVQKKATPPAWVLDTPALSQPYFASELCSLRLYLLQNSPPPFRRRNLFVDSSIGTRI